MQIFNLNTGELPTALAAIEELSGYAFTSRDHLMNALTHSSFSAEYPNHPYPCNERLEFLGDAVLQLIVSVALMREYPDSTEGKLSQYRSMLVDEEANAEHARRLHLPEALLLGHGECMTGGRERHSIQGDLFEAFLGAVYQDGGYEAAEAVVHRLVPDIREHIASIAPSRNPKGLLNNYVQAQHHTTPRYLFGEQTGPDHSPVFHCAVYVEGKEIGKGEGPSKKQAEEAAAFDALKKFESIQA